LKRAYGLARCTWRGLDHFKAYVWSSVAAYNLARSRAHSYGCPFGSPRIALSGDISVPGQDRTDNLLKVHS
jgi:hypothetical protein